MKILPFIFVISLIFCLKDSDYIISKKKTIELKNSASFKVVDYHENFFRGWTVSEFKNTLNTWNNMIDFKENVFKYDSNIKYPDSYDFRNAFPQCVLPVRNQGQCGASWAISLLSALSNRYCMNNKSENLSPQDMLSCDTWDYGCNGGDLSDAFNYTVNTGVVNEECWPFESSQGYVPPCRSSCKNSTVKWIKFHCKPNSVITVKGEKPEKTELSLNGPVITSFSVYEDFMYYKSGIYHHKSGGLMGNHVVKVIGYGINPEKYWIAENVWGPSWGEKGYFRIGAGECDFDNFMMICSPEI